MRTGARRGRPRGPESGEMAGTMDAEELMDTGEFQSLFGEAAKIKQAMVKEKRADWERAADWMKLTVMADADVRRLRAGGLRERLEACERFKRAGTDRFNAGEFDQAVREYVKGVSVFVYFERPEDRGVEGDDRLPLVNDLAVAADVEANELVAALFVNIALCCWKEKELAGTVYAADRALEIDRRNVKALYFRGLAYAGQDTSHTLELAVRDLEAARNLSPNNRQIIVAYQRLKAEKVKQDRKDRATYGKIFDQGETDLYTVEEIEGYAEKRPLEPTQEEIRAMVRKAKELGIDLRDKEVWDELKRIERKAGWGPLRRWLDAHRWKLLEYSMYGIIAFITLLRVWLLLKPERDPARESLPSEFFADAPLDEF